jgi:hypothetical protein
VQKRLQSFLEATGIMPKYQSAYRMHHSTETALLKVFDDLLLASDRGDLSALVMLDLTAAFDTVDHELLISRLERIFGLRNVTLSWFRSYLMDRSYCVVYRSIRSGTAQLHYSVPQGSLLGPILFTYILLNWKPLLRRSRCTFTCTPMTVSYTCTVSLAAFVQHQSDLSSALMPLHWGWLLAD